LPAKEIIEMGSFSIWHWLIVAIVLLLLFGKGRFSEMMGDVAKGIKSFKKGMSEDEEAAASAHAAQQRRIAEAPPAQPHTIAPQPGDAAGGTVQPTGTADGSTVDLGKR
jgi:sec-independent protein translocase protein TatA